MSYFWRFAAALLLLPAAATAAQGKDEKLVSPDLPGFVVAHSDANSIKSITVEIPQDETRDNWTRNVTTQWFKRLAKDFTPGEYLDEVREKLAQSCPGGTVSPVLDVRVHNRDGARIRVICPETPAGHRLSFLMLAIAGKKDMFVKQVAFRGNATSEDYLWGLEFLRDTRLCKRKSKEAGCR